MKTKIKRHYRSAISVLLSVCMLISCMTVGLIATDAARVTGGEDTVGASVEDSSRVGQTNDIIFKYWRSGETAKEVIITSKNVAGTFTVTAGDYYFGVDNKGTWLYNTGNGSSNFPNGTAVGNTPNYSQDLWVKKEGNNAAEMENHYGTFSEGTYTVLWKMADSNGLRINIALKPNDISLSVGSIADAEAIVKVGTTTLEEDDTKTVGAGVSGTITVTPDDEHQKATKWYYEGDSANKYDLVPDGKGNYVASFTTPTSDKKILFDSLESKPQYYVTTALDPSSVSFNGASANVGGAAGQLAYEGDVVTLNVTDATSGNYRFKNWNKGTTPNKLTTSYVVKASDASGTQNISGTDYAKITATANFVDITDTIDLYLDVKGASPSWSVPPYAHVWNSANAGTDIIAPTAMTSYKGTVYKISGVDPRCDKIEFYDATNKAATQTGGLTIPSAAFADHSKKYVYRLRSKSWSDNADSTATNHYTAVADQTSITNRADVYSDIKATFFDYYTDYEISQFSNTTNGWLKTRADDVMLGGSYWHEPYTRLNKALSDYASANSLSYPLYFGDFGAPSGGYNKRSDGYTGANSNSGGNGYNLNPQGVADSTATNFKIAVNSNLATSDTDEDGKHKSVIGLSGNSLKDGIIQYYKSGVSDQNGAPMVLFDEDWLTEGNSRGEELASIIDSPFPVKVHNYKRIYFNNSSKNWDPPYIYAYYKKSGTTHHTSGTWPGSKMKKLDGETSIYYFDVDPDTTNVIFSNNGSSQTGDGDTETAIGNNNYYDGSSWTTRSGTNVKYYGYDSTDGRDNAWFENLKSTSSSNPLTIKYSDTGSNVINSANGTAGFYPFEAGVTKSGNTGKAWDLGFGVKLEFDFTLGAGGQIDGIDQVFEYSGDDDLWVFVDGQLLLDLGGDHFQSEGSINFAKKTVTASNVKTDLNSATRNVFPADFDNTDTTAVHKMTIYYMERGMFDSNLKFGFSISPVGNQFVNEKKVSVENVNEALKSEVEAYAVADKFDYTLKQSANEGTINTGVTPHTNSMAASETYSPVAVKSYKLDPENTAGESLTTTITGGFTMKPEQTATFLNQLSLKHYIQLTETPNVANNNKYVYEPNVLVYDMTNGNEIPLTGTGDQAGYFFYATKYRTGTVSDIDPTKVRALWTNEVQTRDVTITKTVPEGVVNNPNFTFTVLLKLPGSSDFHPYELDCTVGSGTATVPANLDELGQIRIKKGKTVTLTGIPVGTEIRISEDNIPNPFRLTNKAVVGTNVSDTEVSDHPERIDLTVDSSAGNVEATFTNNINTQQVIVKKVVTNSTDISTEFPITVKIKSDGSAGSYDTTIKYKKSTAENPDAQITFSGDTLSESLKANAYLTFTLPVGAYVEVAETDFSSTSGFENFDFTKATAVTYKADETTGYSGATNIGATTNFTLETGEDAHVIITNVGKGYDVTIAKKLVSGTSAKLYTINVKTKESLAATSSTPYIGEYEVYDKDGVKITTRTMTAGVIDLGVDDYIVLKAVAENTVLEITEKVIDETYVRAFHYAYTTVDGTQVTATTGTGPLAIDNGVCLTVTAETGVDIYNKAWTYRILYKYPGYLSRYYTGAHIVQSYTMTGDFTDEDFDETTGRMTIGRTTSGSSAETYPCAMFKGYDDAEYPYKTTEDTVKNFITSQAPYEDNFMTSMTWNPNLNPNDTSKELTTIQYFPLIDGQHVNIETSADTNPNDTIHVYFRLPYDFDALNKSEGTGMDPTYNDQGKIVKKVPTNYRVTTQYAHWFTKNGLFTEEENSKWIQAPAEIYDTDGTKYVFRHWSMVSVGKDLETPEPQNVRLHAKKDEYEYKRCYNNKFNMTLYQDTYVEPVYILESNDPTYGNDASLSPAERETKDTTQVKYGGAIINFLENSRNQWNNGGGSLYSSNYENIPGRLNLGDRVFSDFLLSFNYNDLMLKSPLGKYRYLKEVDPETGEEVEKKEFVPYLCKNNEIYHEYGFLLEVVDNIQDENQDEKIDSMDILDQEEYRNMYNSQADGTNPEAYDQMVAAVNFLDAGTAVSSDGTFIVKSTKKASGLDNKNEVEYSSSLPLINHTSGESTGRNLKVFRAYAYLKDYNLSSTNKSDYTWNGEAISDDEFAALSSSSHKGKVLQISKPVYFTIFNIASVANGTPFDDKGGQS